MTHQNILNKPWFYFVLSLIHQGLVFAPGPFPNVFPDSGSYLAWNPQRTPLYPWILSVAGSYQIVAVIQILIFSLAALTFHVSLRMVLEKLIPEDSTLSPSNLSPSNFSTSRIRQLFLWGGSLYFATNFEFIQFSPTILTESLGISFFLFYFLSLLAFRNSRPGRAQNALLVLSFLLFPVILFLLRPSFIFVPIVLSGFLILQLFQKEHIRTGAYALLCLCLYGGTILSYAVWNRVRLGHIAVSDIGQHQILANYMAQGMLTEEAAKPEASARLKAFGAAYDITKLDPEKKDSQYLLFGQWQEMNPEKDLYTELVLVNRELLTRRPFGYVKAALRNLSSLIDGRASFNYYPIENRDLVSKAYFWIQFILDNLFCFFWFVALGYYLMTFRKRNFFGDENLLFLLIASQFLTIAFVGYSELRRQSIGVGSIQIIFVISMWILMCRKRLFNHSH